MVKAHNDMPEHLIVLSPYKDLSSSVNKQHIFMPFQYFFHINYIKSHINCFLHPSRDDEKKKDRPRNDD